MAQDISGTALATSWASASHQISYRLLIQWDGANWVDETGRLVSASCSTQVYDALAGLPLLGTVAPGRATLVMANDDWRYSIDYAGSPLHAHIGNGIYRVPFRLEAGYYAGATPERLRQFTGEIEGAKEVVSGSGRTVTFSCLDNAIKLMQDKRSTTMATNQRADSYISTILALAGITGAARDLDTGMGLLPWAWMADENLWDEIQDVAQADGGMFYFSKEGVALYRRMTAPLERAHSKSSQASLNQGKTIWMDSETAWRNVYNAVTVEWSPRGAAAVDVVYQAPGTMIVYPGTTRAEHIRWRTPVTAIAQPVRNTDYRAAYYGGGVPASGDLSVSVSSVVAQRGVLSITNRHASLPLYIYGLQVRGNPVIGEESQESRYETTLSPSPVPGRKEYLLKANPYVQSRAQADRIGGYLRDRLQRPRRLVTWRGPAVPWIELLDRVRVDHSTWTEGPGTDIEGWVVGIEQSMSAHAWIQTLTILPADDVFAYSNYFIVGSSTYHDTASDRVAY